MCDSPIQAYLCKNPNKFFKNFFICTKQYHEYAQFDKEYLFFTDKYLNRFCSVQTVWLPCGKCIQCLDARSKSWEIRAILEKNSHVDSCCVTLTYDDEHLPRGSNVYKINEKEYVVPDEKTGIINYKDVQDFVKRIRKYYGFKKDIRYIVSAEYGSSGSLRPHYHVLFFGFSPFDLDPKRVRRSKKGTLLYKSKFLDEKWNKGFVDVGKCDMQACRYVAQYCCKNLLKERKCSHISQKMILKHKNNQARECIHASIGLGLSSFLKNYHSIINTGFIQYGKYRYSIPRYFIKKLEVINNRLFQIVKKKGHDFWLNFVWDDEAKRIAMKRTHDLLEKLNLFHSEQFNLLVA